MTSVSGSCADGMMPGADVFEAARWSVIGSIQVFWSVRWFVDVFENEMSASNGSRALRVGPIVESNVTQNDVETLGSGLHASVGAACAPLPRSGTASNDTITRAANRRTRV